MEPKDRTRKSRSPNAYGQGPVPKFRMLLVLASQS